MVTRRSQTAALAIDWSRQAIIILAGLAPHRTFLYIVPGNWGWESQIMFILCPFPACQYISNYCLVKHKTILNKTQLFLEQLESSCAAACTGLWSNYREQWTESYFPHVCNLGKSHSQYHQHHNPANITPVSMVGYRLWHDFAANLRLKMFL